MKKIFPKNLAIDTSFFVKSNFLAGNDIQRLESLIQQGIIRLFITDIVEKEIIKKFLQNLKSVEDSIEGHKRKLTSSVMILRNSAEYQEFFKLPKIEAEKTYEDFLKKFSEWISNNQVQIVSSRELTAGEIFDDYFNSEPPFQKSNDKKNEFPDAFSIKALINHFKKHKESFYFLSLDHDFLSQKDKNLKVVKDFGSLANELINKHSLNLNENKALKIIEKSFKTSRLQIEKDIKDRLIDLVFEEAKSVSDINGIDIEEINFHDVDYVDFSNYQIVELKLKDKNVKATIKIDVDFSYVVELEGRDYDIAYYDSEESEWLNLNDIEFHSRGSNNVSAYFRINFNLDSDIHPEFELETVDLEDYFDIENGIE